MNLRVGDKIVFGTGEIRTIVGIDGKYGCRIEMDKIVDGFIYCLPHELDMEETLKLKRKQILDKL